MKRHQVTSHQPLATKRAAFTLIELLVVITVISVLMAILIPCLHAARDRAKRTVCASHLQQIGRGIMAYGNDYDRLPPMGGLEMASGLFTTDWFYLHLAYWTTDPDALGKEKKLWRAYGLGYLHQNKVIENPKVFHCPAAAKDRRYDIYAERYSWPFEKRYPMPLPAHGIYTSYYYTPQGTGREKFSSGYYAYKFTNRLTSLNPRAPLALDAVTINDYSWTNGHWQSGRKVAGMNILYGDGSVRFRAWEDSEREFIKDNTRDYIVNFGTYRALLYMFRQ